MSLERGAGRDRQRAHRPGSDALEKKERAIKWVYQWLLLSSFLTVRWMFVDVLAVEFISPGSTMAWSLAVLAPASLHLVLLKDRHAPQPFVRAHSRQALWLAVVRALTAWVLMGLTRGEAAMGWFLVGGSLWFFGSIWGWRQVNKGDCWLIRMGMWSAGEFVDLPRAWALPSDQRTPPAATLPADLPTPPRPQPKPSRQTSARPTTLPGKAAAGAPEPTVDYGQAYTRGKALVNQGRREEAVVAFLEVFNHGPAGLRRRSIERLEALGEVEGF